MTDVSLFTVGVITGPHGVRGEAKVYPMTDFADERFKPGSRLELHQAGLHSRELVVRNARKQKNLWIVSFEEIHSIEEVERLRQAELKVSKDALIKLPENVFYIHDLIGCSVFDESGEKLGELSEVLQPGANDVYVVRRADGREVLLPAIADCIRCVDIVNKRVDVYVLPGLLDD